MFEILLRKLTVWRNEKAKAEGVDLFRILPNKTLEEIARSMPEDKTEMTAIKGIKEAKFAKYGREILKIVIENSGKENSGKEDGAEEAPLFWKNIENRNKDERKIFSVGEFLDVLNNKLVGLRARVRGEISSLEERERVIYFSVRDKSGEGLISCFIFRSQYEILGVRLEEGAEIIVEGYPEVYKPYGRLSFRADVIEMEGEGALKKEYELLKKKLEEEGFFLESSKKRFVRLPQKIGLITSREGAAIGDFVSNVGQFGLHIQFINSSVEGKRAVFELMKAIRSFERMDIDALVVIRGGGSLESLQAFNNEALVRESRKIKVPIVCGVGHDRDISLFSLAADYSVSTPTAAARLIGGLWDKETGRIDFFEKSIFESYDLRVRNMERVIRNVSLRIESCFEGVLRGTESRCENFSGKVIEIIETDFMKKRSVLERCWNRTNGCFCDAITKTDRRIERVEDSLTLNDPQRQLRLGYGIISKNGVCVKSVDKLHMEEMVRIKIRDGEIDAQIKRIKKFKE